MTPHETVLFESYLWSEDYQQYLEFGAGESTLKALAADMDVTTVEADPRFLPKGTIPNFYPHIVDLGKLKTWSRPADTSRKHIWPLYSSIPFASGQEYDLILVDGRFRVACLLQSILNCPNAVIMCHDFTTSDPLRPYTSVLPFVDTIARADSLMVFFPKLPLPVRTIQALLQEAQYDFA